MKRFKMIGIAVAAFALASLAMAAAPRLVERGLAMVQGQQAAVAPAATGELSALETAAVASAQEATSLPQ
ncbi:MAG TPA: hypothetical protein VJX29_06290 [Candidatus Acidoferrales bacterium]|nr:hypothetical protein [Candidatus Acidoferrales bacterium]